MTPKSHNQVAHTDGVTASPHLGDIVSDAPKAVAEKAAQKKAVVKPLLPKAKNGRRRRRRRRGPGRPAGSKKKAA